MPSPLPGRSFSKRPGYPRLAWGLAVAAALLAGCDSASRDGGGSGGSSPDPAIDNVTAASREEAARLLGRVREALALAVPNASAARLANVRSVPGGAICGEVEAGIEGALHPFVVLPGGEAVVSAGPELRLEDPDDPFPDLYMRYCASVEELRRLGDRMNGSATVEPPPPLPDPLPDIGPVDIPADTPPAPNGERAPQQGGDDSFFNSVVRAPPPAAPSNR